MSETKPGSDKQESASIETKQRLVGGFPIVNLEKAISMMKKVWEKEKRNPAPASSIVEHWGYAAKSSGGFQAIASLKRFGLLEEISGPQRTLKVSGAALDLLKYEETDLLSYRKLVRGMALLPAWYEMLWNKYSHELPSDKTLESFLVFDNHMEQPQAKLLMRTYKETISFAKMAEPDMLEEIKTTQSEIEAKRLNLTLDGGPQSLIDYHDEVAAANNKNKGKKVLATYSIPIGASEATISFTGEKLSVEDFDALADYVAIFKKQFERKQRAEDSQVLPTTKHRDLPPPKPKPTDE